MANPRAASGRNAGNTFPIDVIIVDTSGTAVTGTGNGYINDGVDTSIRATVVDYANSNPLTVRLTDTNGDYVAAGAGTQYVQDAALTVATTVGGMAMGRASAAAPTGVSADNDAVIPWYLRSGAVATVLTAAGALIGGDAANGLDVDVTRMSALVAGAAIIGKVGVDQTTPGTTNAVFATNFPTTVDTNSGNKSASTIRVVLATDQPQLTNKLLVTPDANSAVNVAQVGGTNAVSAGLAGTLAVGGSVATNVAITSNPINNGAQGVSSENSAVTTGRMVQLVSDLVGKLIVLPYANPENFVSGAITAAMTSTTSTSLIASPGGSLRNYITQITVSNSHATVGTDIIIQDGSGGTTLYTIPAAAVYGGAVVTFPVPLRQPTTATALFCANVTTGASTKVSATGYKGL